MPNDSIGEVASDAIDDVIGVDGVGDVVTDVVGDLTGINPDVTLEDAASSVVDDVIGTDESVGDIASDAIDDVIGVDGVGDVVTDVLGGITGIDTDDSIGDIFTGLVGSIFKKRHMDMAIRQDSPVSDSKVCAEDSSDAACGTAVISKLSGTGVNVVKASPSIRSSKMKRQGTFMSSPKGTNVLGSAAQFLIYIKQVYGLAVTYRTTHPSAPSANVLVTQWMRHIEYNNLQWTALVGSVDAGFINTVDSAGVKMIDLIVEPKTGLQIKASHFGACMSGVLSAGEAIAPDTNNGDIAGWGGDLITFYGEWRAAIGSGNAISGSAFAMQQLANDQPTTFKLRDLIEDVDCFNVAIQIVRNPALSIADLIDAEYNGGYVNRVTRFYAGRFGTVNLATATATDVLFAHNTAESLVTDLGKWRLITGQAGSDGKLPEVLASEDPAAFADFVKGFVDRLKELIAEEA